MAEYADDYVSLRDSCSVIEELEKEYETKYDKCLVLANRTYIGPDSKAQFLGFAKVNRKRADALRIAKLLMQEKMAEFEEGTERVCAYRKRREDDGTWATKKII